jgi:hypothetical protein
MNRIVCNLVGSMIVTASAFAGLYWCSRPLLHYFGVSEDADGIALVPFLVICLGCVVIGMIVGLFPVALRPFLSSAEFWYWIGTERTVTIPLLNPVLERWAVLFYGNRSDARSPRNGM